MRPASELLQRQHGGNFLEMGWHIAFLSSQNHHELNWTGVCTLSDVKHCCNIEILYRQLSSANLPLQVCQGTHTLPCWLLPQHTTSSSSSWGLTSRTKNFYWKCFVSHDNETLRRREFMLNAKMETHRHQNQNQLFYSCALHSTLYSWQAESEPTFL